MSFNIGTMKLSYVCGKTVSLSLSLANNRLLFHFSLFRTYLDHSHNLSNTSKLHLCAATCQALCLWLSWAHKNLFKSSGFSCSLFHFIILKNICNFPLNDA